MADEILGISGHFDLSDIQRSINELIDGLDKIGLKTDVLSKRMNDAMNDIARSTDDAATKNKRALDVMSQGIAEAKNALANYPEQLRRAMNEADATAQATARLEASLAKLKEKFSDTTIGTEQYRRLKSEMAGVEQQIINNNHAHEAQLVTIQQMESGYSTLVQMYGLGTAATTANAVAHGAVTAATGAESLAHAENAKAISEEEKQTDSSAETTKKRTAAQKEAYEELSKYQVMVGLLSQSLDNDRSVENYENVKRKISEVIEEVGRLLEIQNRITSNPIVDNSTAKEREEWNEFISGADFQEAQQKGKVYGDFLSELHDKLSSLKKEFEDTGDKAAKATEAATNGTPKQIDAYQTIQDRIEVLKTRLEQLQEVREKALHVGSSDWMIPSAIAESGANVGLWGEEKSEAIRRVAADIDEVKKELAEAEQKARDFTEAASHTTTLAESLGYDKMSISELLNEQERLKTELDKWNAELEKLREKKGFDEQSEKAKKLKGDIQAAKEAQEALNKELEGRPGYQRFFNNLQKGFKDLGQNIKNTFSQLKGSFSGGEKGFGGLFSLLTSGKFLGWTAAIGAAGGAIKGLSDSAESLNRSLNSLRPYVDDDVLGKLRQSFIDTALAGSAQSTEDMVAAATRWVKYYESIRNVPEAIQHVVDASRELATITGTSADKAAETLTKLGGQFHLTAEQAMNSVNILVNASRDPVVNINELMQALTSSGARVNMNGASFKEYAAAISLTSSQYGSASQAASAYQRILQRLSTETNDNFNPKVVGVTKAFQNLKQEMEKGTDLSKKFGKMVWSQAQYFIKNADAIAEYTDKLDDATGKENALARAEQTAAHHKAELSNALSALAQSINLNLTPAFTRIVNGIVRFVDWCGKAIQKAGELKNSVQSWLGIENGNKPSIHWTAQNAREQYRSLLRNNGNALGASAEMIAAYKASDSSGLSIDDLRQIIREENDKWRRVHPVLQSATTKGDSNEPSSDNSVTDTKAQSALEKRMKTEEDLAKRRRKYLQEQAEQALSAKMAEWEATIAMDEEGAEKDRKMLEFNHQQRLNDIERWKRQQIEKNVEYAATEYDKNRKKGSQGFYALGLDKGIGLTPDQEKEYNAKLAIESANTAKESRERADALVKSHQSYTDKKIEIDKEYADTEKRINDEITEAQKRGESDRVEALKRALLEAKKQRAEGQANLSLQELKESPDYIRAFEDLKNTSTETLEYLIGEFERTKEAAAKSLTPEELREYTSTIQQMYDELMDRNPFESIRKSAVNLAAAQERLKTANTEVANAQKKVNRAKEVGDINKLKEAEKELTEAKKKQRKASDDVKKAQNDEGKAYKSATVIIDNFSESLSELGDSIGGFEGQILNVISNVMTFATTCMTAIKTTSQTTSAALRALESASVILAVISAAIQLMQALSSLFKDSHSQYEEFAEAQKEINKLRDSVNDYSLAVMKARMEQEKWFSSTGFQDLADQAKLSTEALQNYYEKAAEAQAIYENESGGGWLTSALSFLGGAVAWLVSIPGKLVGGALDAIGLVSKDSWFGDAVQWMTTAGTGGVEGLIGKYVGDLIDSQNEYEENTIAALKNLRIETRESSSGFLGTGIGGHSQETEDLREWVKNQYGEELFDPDTFMVNVDLAQQVIKDYGDKLVGETKETLEKLIELKQEYDKFNEQLQEYVSELYSPLVDNMTDALFDWLSSSEDVMDKFKEYAGETFASIAKEMTKQMVVTSLFEPLKTKLKEIYQLWALSQGTGNEVSMESLTNEIMNSFDTFVTNAEKQLPSLQQLVQYIDKRMNESGLNILGEGTTNPDQQATYNSLEKWTYDQADELILRATASQIIDEHIFEGQAQIVDLVTLISQRMEGVSGGVSMMSESINTAVELHRQSIDRLDMIVVNTNPIPEIRDIVKKISNNL